jgi:hypothetical protein
MEMMRFVQGQIMIDRQAARAKNSPMKETATVRCMGFLLITVHVAEC